MKVKDTNPYSKHCGKITEAEVTFMFKGYEVMVSTNGTGWLDFEGSEVEFVITDAFKKTYSGKGSIEDAIKFILNKESL